MNKQYISEALTKMGYSTHTIKSLLERNHKIGKEPLRPSLISAIEMESKYGIPTNAWRDIKSFIATSSQKAS
jgi:hypothetical protein